ncbi:MAG: hypothetical protein Q4F73_09280, partial [Corynebacterium sp.]|nr:hypothetical protein [Corynebacterium sp.]
LSTIVGPFSPEIVARIELEIDDATYVLATMRRLPRGVNALDYTREGLAAQVVSHTQGIELGRTLRFLHDSLLLAFPYEWASAAEHMQRLEDRLDDFVHMAPRLAEYAPWIRDWYRSLDGEMLVQRLHGNVNLKQMWLGPDERWVIGGWAGEVVAPMEERARLGCPLEDLASLQRSMFWACRGNKAWCIKAMAAIFEGYGEPMMSALFSAFVLDRACKEVAEETMSADGEPDLPFEFLEWFREVALPTRETMEPSSFLRPA